MPLAERRGIPTPRWGCIKRGILSFSKESIPLRPPRERTRGLAPRPRLHWQSVARRAARPAESGAVYVASPRIPSFRHHSQPRPTPWGASDGSWAADCVRTRHCCARRGQMKQMLQLVENCGTVNTGRCTNGRRLVTSPKGGETMRITFHIGDVTVTIIVKSRNRHSAK